MKPACYWSILCFLLWSDAVVAFESARTVPAGRGGLSFRHVFSEAREKTDRHGQVLPLAEPMHIKLTFDRVLRSEKDQLQKKLMQAFINAEDIPLEDDLGTFTADIRARVHVFVPVFVSGITDRLTLIAAMPFFDVSTSARVGFRPNNATASEFFNLMSGQEYNQGPQGFVAREKINNAEAEFYRVTRENGYDDPGNWRDQGPGDLMLLARYKVLEHRHLIVTPGLGFNLATGRVDDPDNLGDIPFGDGQNDVIFSLTVDEPLTGGFFFNQYARYTWQTKGYRKVRLRTMDEQVEVEKATVAIKPGDKLEGGLSLQWEPGSGVQAGLGAVWQRKWADNYDVPVEVAMELERETDQESLLGEMKLGYSTLPAVMRGEFPVPFSFGLEYRTPYTSRNMVLMDQMQVDFSMYF